jgi:hypothetical protein
LKTPTSRVGASVLSSSRSIKIVTMCFMQFSSMPATRRYRLFSAGLPRCLHSAAGAMWTGDRRFLGLSCTLGLVTVRPADRGRGTLGRRAARVRLGVGVRPPVVQRPRVHAASLASSVDHFSPAFMVGGERPPIRVVRL